MPQADNWQRFTDSATNVIFIAKEEARRFGMQEVGPGHLLLGLFHVSDGVAARVLMRLGVSESQARAEVARQGGTPNSQSSSAKRLTLSPAAKKALEYALQEAQELNAKLGVPDFADTEHLLLGLLREGGSAVRLLAALGVEAGRVRQEVLNDLGGSSSPADTKKWHDAASPWEQVLPRSEQELPDVSLPQQFPEVSAYAQALALGIQVFAQSKAFPAEDVCSLTADLLHAARAVCLHLVSPAGGQVSAQIAERDLREAIREISHTQVLLDFAVGYGYLAKEVADRLIEDYNALLNELGQ